MSDIRHLPGPALPRRAAWTLTVVIALVAASCGDTDPAGDIPAGPAEEPASATTEAPAPAPAAGIGTATVDGQAHSADEVRCRIPNPHLAYSIEAEYYSGGRIVVSVLINDDPDGLVSQHVAVFVAEPAEMLASMRPDGVWSADGVDLPGPPLDHGGSRVTGTTTVTSFTGSTYEVVLDLPLPDPTTCQ